jgi:hypothetical protein
MKLSKANFILGLFFNLKGAPQAFFPIKKIPLRGFF